MVQPGSKSWGQIGFQLWRKLVLGFFPLVGSMLEAQEAAMPEDAPALLSALEKEYSQPYDDLHLTELILAVGNTKNPNALEPLLVLKKKERHPELLEKYHWALAKLGFLKEIRKIEFDLTHGDSKTKGKALKVIQYLLSPDWTDKVIPLLKDKSISRTFHMGDSHIPVLVQDDAITTLNLIDSKHRVPSTIENFNGPFSADERVATQKAYGLIK